MIKISNGTSELTVTKGVFENLFKDLGYVVVGDNKKQEKILEAVVINETIVDEEQKEETQKVKEEQPIVEKEAKSKNKNRK